MLAVLAPLPLAGAIQTKVFTGTFQCFLNCNGPNPVQNSFLDGVTFAGSYSYDDAVVPTSGDPSTFRDYGTGFDVTMNIGNGLYTLQMTNGGIEIARNHYAGRRDDVFLFSMPSPTFGGSAMATFAAVAPAGDFRSFIVFTNNTAPNVLPDTLIANWPQTIAAWTTATGFAGAEFYIQNSSSDVVGFRGPFATLGAKVTPSLSSAATPQGTVPLGLPLSDSATLSGGLDPTGTLVFTLYGPNDPTCTGQPAFVSPPVPVNGNGEYVSGSFTPTQVGAYSWIASYSGDDANEAVADACGLPAQGVDVAAANVPTAGSVALLMLALGLSAMGVLALRGR